VTSELAVVKALLESERIPEFIVDRGIHQLHFLIAVATGGARLLRVAAEYAAVARRILVDFSAGELMIEEDSAAFEAVEQKTLCRKTSARGACLAQRYCISSQVVS